MSTPGNLNCLKGLSTWGFSIRVDRLTIVNDGLKFRLRATSYCPFQVRGKIGSDVLCRQLTRITLLLVSTLGSGCPCSANR